jgi:hypothetical protein
MTTFDWKNFLARLQQHPKEAFRLYRACPADRIRTVESQLGRIPPDLRSMLEHFNGGAIFDRMVRLFGLSEIEHDHAEFPFLKGAGLFLDVQTTAWRQFDPSRTGDWLFGITNYGGELILTSEGAVRQWDTSVSAWDNQYSYTRSFDAWMERTFQEGVRFLSTK